MTVRIGKCIKTLINWYPGINKRKSRDIDLAGIINVPIVFQTIIFLSRNWVKNQCGKCETFFLWTKFLIRSATDFYQRQNCQAAEFYFNFATQNCCLMHSHTISGHTCSERTIVPWMTLFSETCVSISASFHLLCDLFVSFCELWTLEGVSEHYTQFCPLCETWSPRALGTNCRNTLSSPGKHQNCCPFTDATWCLHLTDSTSEGEKPPKCHGSSAVSGWKLLCHYRQLLNSSPLKEQWVHNPGIHETRGREVNNVLVVGNPIISSWQISPRN